MGDKKKSEKSDKKKKKSEKKSGKGKQTLRAQLRVGPDFQLAKLDPEEVLHGPDNEDDAREAARKLEPECSEWHEKLWAQSKGGGKKSLLLVFQGMDTSGKGGAGKAIDRLLDPQGFSIVGFGPPTAEEKSHPYLWRYQQQLPDAGKVRMFDRSHYESVLIERVRGFAPQKDWSLRYDEINAWEKSLTDAGTTVLKFMLYISKDEQKKRFTERLEDPTKHWKYNPRDLDERTLWDDYMAAYQDALVKCSTDHAPWFVIPANHKWHRDWLVSQLVVETFREMNPGYPSASFDLAAEKKRVKNC